MKLISMNKKTRDLIDKYSRILKDNSYTIFSLKEAKVILEDFLDEYIEIEIKNNLRDK